MKFPVAALFAALTTACFAQRASIASPANNTSVTPGSKLVVQVVQPNSPTSFIEVAVVLAILACPTPSPCIPPNQALGTVLYNGPFNPQFSPSSSDGRPQQNFTVTIPSTLPAGPAQLSLFHILLNGALNAPFSETQAVSVNVV